MKGNEGKNSLPRAVCKGHWFSFAGKILVLGVAWSLILAKLEAKLVMRICVQVIFDLFSKCSQEKPAREWVKPDREG